MKTPKSFRNKFGVLNTGMTVVVIIYTTIGLFGYLKYGNSLSGSVTLNIPQNEMYLILNLFIFTHLLMNIFN